MKPILFNTEMVRAILEGRKTVTRQVVRGAWPDWSYLGITDNAAVTAVDRYGEEYPKSVYGLWAEFEDADGPVEFPMIKVPYRPGDILYVRETWNFGYIETSDVEGSYDAWFEEWDWRTREQHSYLNVFSRFWYKADDDDVGDVCIPWRPSIHMPKEAARIFLRVTDVRVERLQTSFFEPICPIFAVQAEGIDIGDTCRECIENYGEPCCVDTVDEDGSDLYGGECGELDQSRGEFSDLWDSTIKPADRERYGWAANPWVWVIEFERCEKPERGRE